MDNLLSTVMDPLLPLCVIKEQLLVLVGRIDATLYSSISQQLADFELKCEGGARLARFPAAETGRLITAYDQSLNDPESHTAFLTLTAGLRGAISPEERFVVTRIATSITINRRVAQRIHWCRAMV